MVPVTDVALPQEISSELDRLERYVSRMSPERISRAAPLFEAVIFDLRRVLAEVLADIDFDWIGASVPLDGGCVADHAISTVDILRAHLWDLVSAGYSVDGRVDSLVALRRAVAE